MRLFAASLFTFLIIASLLSFSPKSNKPRNAYLGQRCPPDMEFIAGNDQISSFFIGKSQETNLNYAIYQDWLKRVFVDLPQIDQDAKPHEVEYSDLYKFNDPYLKGQLSNPAFAYYPVVGCDWLQVQQYLNWKTDRLSEDILIQVGYLKHNPQQTNSDNFNTEAMIAGQYEGLRTNKWPTQEQYYGVNMYARNMGKDFPFLFTGYRLPTEEEWEHASKPEFQNNQTKRRNRYPFGKKYFLFDYMMNGNTGAPVIWDYVANAGTGESDDLMRIKGGTTYDTKQYGIFNMGNNVEEWMMDKYSPAVIHYPNIESIFTLNNFRLATDKMYKNEDGQMIEKDSSGSMPYKFMGYQVNGQEMRIVQYSRRNAGYEVTDKLPNPDSLKIKAAQRQTVEEMIDEIDKYNKTKYVNTYYYSYHPVQNPWPLANHLGHIQNLEYYRVEHKKQRDGSTKDTLVLDPELILNSSNYVRDRSVKYTRRVVQLWKSDDTATQYRVVKTGTWKNPSTTARRKMKETEASASVGFRAVIQYNGMPIDKHKMVKWK